MGANFTQWCRTHRSMPVRDSSEPQRKARATTTTTAHGEPYSLNAFFTQAMALLWKWLNRMSQKAELHLGALEARLKRQQLNGHESPSPAASTRPSSSWRAAERVS